MTKHYPVFCGTNSDCSSIPGRSVCKQDKNGDSTCVGMATQCQCSEEEFCTFENKCNKPGKENCEHNSTYINHFKAIEMIYEKNC